MHTHTHTDTNKCIYYICSVNQCFGQEPQLIEQHKLAVIAESCQGPHEKRLLNNLLSSYNTLERPVANESEPLEVKFGLTLQQIIDVVSFSFLESAKGSREQKYIQMYITIINLRRKTIIVKAQNHKSQ